MRLIKFVFLIPPKLIKFLFRAVRVLLRVPGSLFRRENPFKIKQRKTIEELQDLPEKNLERKWNLDVRVAATSRDVGKVQIGIDGKLKFPQLSETPGSYCFTFAKSSGEVTIYIGETAQLQRRFQHYRTPGPSQTTNIRINALMKEILNSGGEVRVSVITSASSNANHLDLSNVTHLDLRDKVARLMVEQAWILNVKSEGFKVENA